MINIQTIVKSKRLTGTVRQFAKTYIREQFIQYKSKLGLFSNPTIKFTHKIGQRLNISTTVVRNLCLEANLNLAYGTMKDMTVRSWINKKIDDGTCQATLRDELTARGILNTRSNKITYGCIDGYRRAYLGLDNNHATSGSPDFVNHLARKRPSVATGGLGVHDANKSIEVTTHLYNIHSGTIYRTLNISETQVKNLFSKEDIEYKSPSFLIAQLRQKRAAKGKVKARR